MRLPRVVIAALGISLGAALPAYSNQGADRGHTLTKYALAITLPATWHGRIYQRPGGLPILQTGNFRLPSGDDDTGTKAIKKMRTGSVFIVLMEASGANGYHVRRIVGPPQVKRSDFLARFKGVPDSHAFARVVFSTRRRYFHLWVQFGVRPAPARLLGEANRVLRMLRVASN